MRRICIVTDSGASFSTIEKLHPLPLTVLPNRITTSVTNFAEGLDYEPEVALRLVGQTQQRPIVTAPSVETYANTFRQLARESEAIVCICPSQQLSTHVSHAQAAARMIVGACPIKVVDSQSISAGQTVLILALSQALAAGAKIEDIDQIVRSVIGRTYFLLAIEQVDALPQLESLETAGALFSLLLNLRPIVSVEHGELRAIAKARSRIDAVERLAEFGAEFSTYARVFILRDHTAHETAERLRARLMTTIPAEQIHSLVYNPSLAALVGLGAVGIAILESDHT